MSYYELIDFETFKSILEEEVKPLDLGPIRYYEGDNQLILILRKKGVDFKCILDKLDILDGTVDERDYSDINQFIAILLGSFRYYKLSGFDEGGKQTMNIRVWEDGGDGPREVINGTG